MCSSDLLLSTSNLASLDTQDRPSAKSLRSTAKPTPSAQATHPDANVDAKKASSPYKNRASSYKNESIQLSDTNTPTRQTPSRNEPNERSQHSVTPKTTKKPKHTGPTKLFVLDTNVLMHDPMCLFRFEEHDIFLPMIVLEELDGHKKEIGRASCRERVLMPV